MTRSILALSLGLSSLLLAACSFGPSRMKPPAGLSESYAVTQTTGTDFTVGAYEVTVLPNEPGSATGAEDGKRFSMSSTFAKQRESADAGSSYTYQVRKDEQEIRGSCMYQGDTRAEDDKQAGIVEAAREAPQSVSCICGDTASVALEFGKKAKMRSFSIEDRKFELKRSFDMVGGAESVDTMGAEIREGGKLVAAVEVVEPGHVWMLADFAEADRLPAVCLMTGLMMAPLE